MKTLRKLLVSLMALVMLLGTGLTAYAAGDAPTVAAITKVTAAKKDTLYTNNVYFDGGNEGAKKIAVEYQYVSVNKNTEYAAPAGLKAESADRGVVKVVGFTDETTSEKTANKKTTVTVKQNLVLQAVGNGTTTVTITDKVNPKKKAAIKVTVKTYAEDIDFNNRAVSVSDNCIELHMADVKNASVNLGAYVTNGNASDKKITYAVDKEATKAHNNGVTATGISVDKNGNVKVTDAAKAKDKVTIIKVTSKDGMAAQFVDVYADETVEATSFTLIQDTNSNSDTLGMLNKKYVLPLKSNRTSEARTYLLNWKENVRAGAFNFTSSNPSVASVDRNGKITANANGTAKITITAKAGNTLKNVKTVTVKVTTDVTYVNAAFNTDTILANNKDTAKIAAKTNTNASNKTVKYEFTNVKDENGADVAAKQIKNYISVDKNGVVKAKKACTAKIRAYAAADNTKDRIVTVTANVPVTSLTLASAEGQTKITKSKVTIYRYDTENQDELTLVPTVNETATNKDVEFTSANENVALVDENGVVTAVGTGSAKITAKATDGSGKSAAVTVTVKTDAYAISTNADANGDIYVEGNDDETKATNFALAKVIGAATNKDASVKTVKYYQVTTKADGTESEKAVTSVKLKMDETATIRVKATDTRTHGVKSATANPVVEEVTLVCQGSGYFTKDIEIVGLETETVLAVGESAIATAEVKAENPATLRKLPNGTKITWTTSNKNVATVDANGVVTAKATGKAVITAKCQGAVSAKMDVYVGRNYATVEKEIDTLLATKAKSENRDWTGVRTNFDDKNNAFDLAILKPNKNINTLEDTGIIEALKSTLLSTSSTLRYTSVYIYDDFAGNVWAISVDGVKTTVAFNGEVVLADVEANEAIEYVSDNVISGADCWKDWNGKTFTITLDTADTQKYGDVTKTWNYGYTYDVAVSMSEDVYESYIDEKAANVAALAVAGVEEIAYDAAHNATDMVVNSASQSIKAAYDEFIANEINMDIVKDIFADATEVTLTATLDGKEDSVTKTREGASDEYIKEVFGEYVDKLINKGVTTLDGLDGANMTAKVTFTSGNVTYTSEYEMNVSLAENVFEDAADARIADAVDGTEFAFGSIGYDEEDNVISVSIKKEFADKKPLDLAGSGVKTILASLVDSEKASKAVVITSKGATTIAVNEETDEATLILTALSAAIGNGTLEDLDDTESTIKVTYVSDNGASKKTLTYTVEYVINDSQTVAGPAVEETTEEVEESTEEVEETVEESTEEIVEETEVEEATEETTAA